MLIEYKRKIKPYPVGEVLEAVPSLDEIVNKFLETGELSVKSQDTLGYDFDSNTPENLDSVPKDKGLIDYVLEGKAAPVSPTSQTSDNQEGTTEPNESSE